MCSPCNMTMKNKMWFLQKESIGRQNYTKTDIRTQIYRITPLPRPKGWPPTELCFLSPFLVIHFYTNCVKLYGIVTPTVPPISFPCNTFSAPPRTPLPDCWDLVDGNRVLFFYYSIVPGSIWICLKRQNKLHKDVICNLQKSTLSKMVEATMSTNLQSSQLLKWC